MARLNKEFRALSLALLALGAAFGVRATTLPLDEDGQWKDEVLYVETDGSKTYFDTGVKVGPNTHVVTCVAFVSWPEYGTSVGAGVTPNGATIAFSPSGSNNGDVWRSTVGGQWDAPGWKNSSYKADANFHVWNLKSGLQRIDGLPIATSTIPAEAPAMCNFVLGARQVAFNGSTTPQVNSFTKMRIRSCKIYDGTTLLKDYIAAYQNGVYGLVDLKDGSFHTASGGSFTGKRQKAAISVDYVESKSGSNLYVNTGIRPTETTRVVADVAFKLTDGTLMGSGGGSSASNVASILFGTAWDNRFQWYVGNAYSATVPGGTKDQNRHIWDLSSGSQKIDNTQYGTATIPSGSTPGPSFILFARRLSVKDAVDSWHPAQVYGCKMYDGEALLRDFRPSFLNGRYCLWDAVTGRAFYGSEVDVDDSSYGKADLGGAPVNVEYKKFSCLQSTGTQYIDTRIKVRQDTRVWARMSFAGFTDSLQCMGFATSMDEKQRISMLLGLKKMNDGKFGGWFGPNYEAPLTYEMAGDTAVHEWDFQNGSQKIDGSEVSAQAYGTGKNNTAQNDTFCLFARNRHWDSSSNPEVDWFSTGKIYGFKIWNGNTLLRDYVAAEVGGRACLYDRVSGLPFFSPVGDEFRAKSEGLIITLR